MNKLWAISAVAVMVGRMSLVSAAIIPAEPEHVVSLVGKWRFKLEQIKTPTSAPADWKKKIDVDAHKALEPFYQSDYVEDTDWHDIGVPSNWEMAGYSPATYGQPDNTSAYYRKWIDVPANWNGRIVKLNFDGVQNGAEVWLNGQPVEVTEPSWGRKNYHESGWTAWQANLTLVVKFGEKNLLAVRVVKNTRSADLDSGDFFFLGGIYRPVTLFSVPQEHVRDIKVETRLRANGKAEIIVIVKTSGEGISVSAQLEGLSAMTAITVNDRTELKQTLDNPRLWSAEFPNLYNMTLDLKNAKGEVVEHITRRIGIREVSIKDGVLLVNGTPIKLTGICRHDVDATHGTAVGEELWRKDLTLMRQANINAVRTSHYPYGSGFYDLCDEMGFYVVDELPYCWCPTDDKEMETAFLQRARETISRDKNHPCVIIWAIGNENKPGQNLQAVADAVKQLDTTRPRLVSCRRADEYNTEFDDEHYKVPAELASAATDKARRAKWPQIYTENPNVWDIRLGVDPGCWDLWGSVLARTWKQVWKSDGICGSFLWEWQDRAVADQSPIKLYEFDPATGINYLKIKGVVDAFRNPRPELYQIKMVYSPIAVDRQIKWATPDVAILNVTNRYSFNDLSQLKIAWHLLLNQKEMKSGSTSAKVAPRSTEKIEVILPLESVASADSLRIDFDDARGWNIVSYQFALKDNAAPPLHLGDSSGVNFPRFNLVMRTTEKDKAKWKTLTLDRTQLINVKADPQDARSPFERPIASIHTLAADIVMESAPTDVVANLQATFADGQFTYHLKWTGKKRVDVHELGWIFEMPAKFDHFSWKREALWSVYPDTNIGRASGTALPDSANVPLTKITRPDAFDFNSTKYNCDWATLTDATGEGLGLTFDADARHHVRGGFSANGDHQLIVNRQCSPPRDISSGVVKDFYLMLGAGDKVDGKFQVGTVKLSP